MNVVVDLPNEKLAKQFLAAKPANLDVKTTTKGSKVEVSLNKGEKITTVAPKVTKKGKKIGVVGISKAENVQLGLILRWVALELDWDTIPNEVLVDPEALTKLIGRYQNKAK